MFMFILLIFIHGALHYIRKFLYSHTITTSLTQPPLELLDWGWWDAKIQGHCHYLWRICRAISTLPSSKLFALQSHKKLKFLISPWNDTEYYFVWSLDIYSMQISFPNQIMILWYNWYGELAKVNFKNIKNTYQYHMPRQNRNAFITIIIISEL